MVSIIIRTRNEERWIGHCLNAVFSQDYGSFEVILVDNGSTDSTLEKASAFDVQVVGIDPFIPGRAINLGIRRSRGDVLVCLSGHCVPVNKDWLRNLVKDLDDPKVAGVYGRQEPLSFTPDNDKRDLITVFPLDKRRQKRDSFFHNANSAFRREVWERFPFDESVTNIEDRVWGQKVIGQGLEIVYEPEASVYHYHGIHHNADRRRAESVVKILESLSLRGDEASSRIFPLDTSSLETVAIIPVTGPVRHCGGKPLIEYTIARAKDAAMISRVVVSTDSAELAEIARRCGAQAPFLRPKALCGPDVALGDILQHALQELKAARVFPDAVVYLSSSYPFRRRGFLDYLVRQFLAQGLDTLLPVQDERRSAWLRKDAAIEMVSRLSPRDLKSDHLYVSLLGLGCVTLPQFIREGNVIGKNLGVQVVKDRFSQLEVRDDSSLALAGEVIPKFWGDDSAWEGFGSSVSTVHADDGGLARLSWESKDSIGLLPG